MRARILLLPGSQQGEALCACAEQILTDISAAFDHVFSLLRGKIGPEVSDKTLDACETSQAILLGDAQCEGAQALYDALDLPLRIRSFCVPEALCSRHETPVKLFLGTALSLDADTLRLAMQSAFRFAQDEDIRILHVAPTGATKAEWEAAVRVQTAAQPLVTADAVAAKDAMKNLIKAPQKMGLLLCPPYAGGILEAAATGLCAHPEIMYDFAIDQDTGVYAPFASFLEEAEDAPAPFAMALAIARMLRISLKLPREAACLEAAIQNVLANHWLPKKQAENSPSMLDLICEQIAVAGELMGKGGIQA
ncbi:MAG: hypothetical protein IJ189_02315 [Clostridia bacterium]|nr:hypothetical protein [Clostridia bacterium]